MKKDHRIKGGKFEIYQRFIENRYSRDDIEYIIRHLQETSADRFCVSTCRKFWYQGFMNPIESENESDFDSILDRIHHKLNLENKRPVSSGVYGPARRVIRNTLSIYYRVAAIIVFVLIFSGLFNFIKNDTFLPEGKVAYSEVIAPMGSRIKIDLPDGSIAWLNHGTILRYPQKFGRISRELFISGEAYFNVQKENRRPFIVKTTDVDIHVLGTTFNVMAYEDDSNIEVVLESGKLEICYCALGKPSTNTASLSPGERILIDKDQGKVSKYRGNSDKYTSWKDGIIIFREDPMDLILKKLENS